MKWYSLHRHSLFAYPYLSRSFLLLPLSLLLSFLPVLHVRLQLRVERIKNLRVLNSRRNVKPSHVLTSVRQVLSDLPQTYNIVTFLTRSTYRYR